MKTTEQIESGKKRQIQTSNPFIFVNCSQKTNLYFSIVNLNLILRLKKQNKKQVLKSKYKQGLCQQKIRTNQTNRRIFRRVE